MAIANIVVTLKCFYFIKLEWKIKESQLPKACVNIDLSIATSI